MTVTATTDSDCDLMVTSDDDSDDDGNDDTVIVIIIIISIGSRCLSGACRNISRRVAQVEGMALYGLSPLIVDADAAGGADNADAAAGGGGGGIGADCEN